jgi:hypothetical protein
MVEGFLLDGIHGNGGKPAVDFGIEDAGIIFPHAANPVFSVPDYAVVGAEPAAYALVILFFIERGFVGVHIRRS